MLCRRIPGAPVFMGGCEMDTDRLLSLHLDNLGGLLASRYLNVTTYWCCTPPELRAARSCEAKGLLKISGEPGKGAHFDVTFT
jgi:hypothetical protein